MTPTTDIIIFDTTMRDGEQSPGASMTHNEKLALADLLETMGVHVIEAGFPAASPGDFEAVQTLARELRGVQICGLTRAREKDIEQCLKSFISVSGQNGLLTVINGEVEKLMRVGCGSAAIGMFAAQWVGHVDEVVVVDDHITGVLSEHQAGRMLDVPPTGIRVKGRRSTPGRYFQVAEPGTGWGGTNIDDPLLILREADAKIAWPGLRLFMVSTTGEQFAHYVLDENLVPVLTPAPEAVRASAERIAENCEPSVCSVLFMGGAGGSLRAGVTENPVRLTQSVKATLTRVTCGGSEAYVWPGGGITVMADVLGMPTNAFGYVPTPALVAPIEFTLRLDDYAALGGHMKAVIPIDSVMTDAVRRVERKP